jgi:DUF971 family protein
MIELTKEQTEPRSLQWLDDSRVGVTWEDGHESVYTLPFLRRVCPCAACRGSHDAPPLNQPPPEKKRFQILNDAQVKQAAQTGRTSVSLRGVSPVGNYAIAFEWTDGHAEGIYSFRYLREMCPCPSCAEKIAAAESSEGG